MSPGNPPGVLDAREDHLLPAGQPHFADTPPESALPLRGQGRGDHVRSLGGSDPGWSPVRKEGRGSQTGLPQALPETQTEALAGTGDAAGAGCRHLSQVQTGWEGERRGAAPTRKAGRRARRAAGRAGILHPRVSASGAHRMPLSPHWDKASREPAWALLCARPLPSDPLGGPPPHV